MSTITVPATMQSKPNGPYRLAARRDPEQRTIVRVGGAAFGGEEPTIIAGPCAVESRAQALEAARAVKTAGGQLLRGGAFKPRTSPYSFQGLGEAGLAILAEARELTGLPIVTEALEPEQIPLVARYADMIQIGARNMANFALLRRAGRTDRPILLKRGMSATVEEWLMAAEYILAEGTRTSSSASAVSARSTRCCASPSTSTPCRSSAS